MEYLPENVTLGEWIPMWLEAYKQGTIKDTSFHQLVLLERLIPDELKSLPIGEIRPIQLQAFYKQFGKGASKSYMDKMRTMVNALFRDAVDNGLCSRNPAQNLRIPRIAEPTKESFTKEETRLILGYIMTCEPSRISTAVMTLLLTGLRRGELLGLKWSDIDNGILTVNRGVFLENLKATVVEGQAKTPASLRPIPLPPEVMSRIQALPKHGEFIFATNKDTLWHPRNFSRDYVRFFDLLREVEPSVRYLPPHACRHTYATLLNQSCSNLRTVQMVLGHTDIKTTARYTHPNTAAMVQAVAEFRRDLIIPP